MSDQIVDSQVFESTEIYGIRQLAEEFGMIQVPTAAMLKKGGEVIGIEGYLRWDIQPVAKRLIGVRFDRNYVVRKLAHDLEALILDMSRSDWENLMREVYREGNLSQED
jgi:hypothetical protein